MAAEPSPRVPDAAATLLVAERAYAELRDRIVTLHLAPGTVLREDELMSEMGIGRTPLREAVKRLALEHLVEVQPRRGTFVTEIEAADIQNITEVRAELEGYAAELAALRLDPETRAAAERLLHEVEELKESGEPEALMRFDERIHRFTWEAAHNPYLAETLAVACPFCTVMLDDGVKSRGDDLRVVDVSTLLAESLAPDGSA